MTATKNDSRRDSELECIREVSNIKAKLDAHIKQCPKEEIGDLIEAVARNTNSLNFLKTFLIPLISIGNLVALAILINITVRMQDKFDEFVKKYYEEKSTKMERVVSDAKVQSKYYTMIENNSKIIENNTKRIENLEGIVNSQLFKEKK